MGNTKTKLPAWTYGVLTAAGVTLVVSMLFAWVDVAGFSQSGLSIAWDENHWLFLVPIAGALLALSAGSRSESTRLAAIGAGVVVAGYSLFQLSRGVIDGGLDSWLVFGGAGVILGGIPAANREWRVIGGVAVLAGFFAPWDDMSLWSVIDFSETVRVLWLVPIGGLVAIGSGISKDANAGRAALVAALLVLGAFAWVIVSVLTMFIGFGAIAALVASSVALVIGLFASRE